MITPYEQARTIAQVLLKTETPPFTGDLIRQQVQKACTIVPLEGEKIEKLVKELERNFHAWIGVASTIGG
jgi:hypothetical protein